MLETHDSDAQHWQDFRCALENFGSLSDEDWSSYLEGAQLITLDAGCTLKTSDESIVGLAFIVSGLICLRYQDSQAEGLIKSICEKGQFCGDLAYLLGKEPVPIRIEAIESSEIISITGPYFRSHLSHRPAIVHSLQAYAADLLSRKLAREKTLLSSTAEDRLEEFLASRPQLAGRIPQKTLAAFLGIAPETLSRLRAKRHRMKREGLQSGSGSSVSRVPRALE